MIPERSADAITRRFADGAEFLATLGTRLDAVARAWDLTLQEPLPIGIGGYLVGARTADGRDAVLKLSPTAPPQDRANLLEAYALRRWAGDGAAALLAADVSAGALLLERCVPGTTIDSLPDDEMLSAGCALASRLHRKPDAEDERTLPRALDEITEIREAVLSRHAGRAAAEAHRELVANPGTPVVCHGDMNPGNVLSHRSGWVAVDPLPLLAEPEYDAVSLVWCKRAWLLAQPEPSRILERRIRLAADALHTDPERIRAWTLVRLRGLLVERSSWGGHDEAPFVRLADLLT